VWWHAKQLTPSATRLILKVRMQHIGNSYSTTQISAAATQHQAMRPIILAIRRMSTRTPISAIFKKMRLHSQLAKLQAQPRRTFSEFVLVFKTSVQSVALACMRTLWVAWCVQNAALASIKTCSARRSRQTARIAWLGSTNTIQAGVNVKTVWEELLAKSGQPAVTSVYTWKQTTVAIRSVRRAHEGSSKIS
jgi:hypothetical protein